jgi:MinD-like ATPase involved in chromosome partitioning or flagellar assembly
MPHYRPPHPPTGPNAQAPYPPPPGPNPQAPYPPTPGPNAPAPYPPPGPNPQAPYPPAAGPNVQAPYPPPPNGRVQPGAPANGQAPAVPPLPPMPQDNWHDGRTPTAEEFARRRQTRPADPVASRGMRGALTKGTLGLLALSPGRRELEYRQEVEMVRRNFGGLRQVTVVNPKGGAGKTVAVLLLAMTFGQKRGGYVLAWDNNETQGTLGMRAQQDFHHRTVRDLMHDLDNFRGAQGRIGDLSQYVRAQGEGMFDVLASDESATAGEMLTADAFGEIRDVVSRFYKLIFVDTGNNVRAENWQAAIDATDQLVVTMSARNDSAETASRMLDHLEQHGRQRLVRQAVTVVSMPPSRRHVDVPAITRHFAARTRTVLIVPYERFIDSGEPIRYPALSVASRDAWLKVAAAVSEGL